MDTFADLSKPRRYFVYFIGILGLAPVLPVASGAFAMWAKYEYSHFLIVSAIYHGINPIDLVSAVAIASIIPVAFGVAAYQMIKPRRSLYGDASLATLYQIRKHGLFDVKGDSILVGKFRNRLIAFNGQLHVFLAALTGTGKGVGFVVPNLLNWRHSSVTLDIKGEAYELTAKYREQELGNEIFRFAPLSLHTHRFNALDTIDNKVYTASEMREMKADDLTISRMSNGEPQFRVKSIDRIAEALFPASEGDEVWAPLGRRLLAVLISLADDMGLAGLAPNTLGQVYRYVGTGSTADLMEADINALKNTTSRISRDTIEGFNWFAEYIDDEGMLNKQGQSIVTTLMTKIKLWADPVIDNATCASDYDMKDLRRKPISIYVVVSPDDLPIIRDLLKLYFNCLIALNCIEGEQLGQKGFNTQCLIILDEFLSMGRMEKLVHSLSYVRGWGLKIATVIQSPKQLSGEYGEAIATAYEENHRAGIYFRPNRMSNEKVVAMAEALGSITALSKSISKQEFKSGRNISKSETKSYLVSPDQIRDMPDNRAFIMIDGLKPIYAQKIAYYEDKEMTAKVNFKDKEIAPKVIFEDKEMEAKVAKYKDLKPDLKKPIEPKFKEKTLKPLLVDLPVKNKNMKSVFNPYKEAINKARLMARSKSKTFSSAIEESILKTELSAIDIDQTTTSIIDSLIKI